MQVDCFPFFFQAWGFAQLKDMLDSMPDSITRFRPEGARDFMVAAANYEVPAPVSDQNGIYGEPIFLNWLSSYLLAILATIFNSIIAPGDAVEPVAPVAQAVHSTPRNPHLLQQTLAKIMAGDGILFFLSSIFLCSEQSLNLSS